MFSKDGPTLFELIHQGLCSTQRGYDLLAPKFDLTPFRTPDDMLEAAIKVIGNADSALDLCCGTGAALRLLRPICREKIVGIDFSSGMLQQAKQKLETTTGTAKVEFIEADVLQMSFHQEFDLITCFGALGHIPSKEKSAFLHRIHRALKPGGRFVFYSAYRPPLLSFRGLALRTFNAAMKLRNILLHPPFIMYYLTFSLPEITTDLKTANFAVEIHPRLCRQYSVLIATRL
jgi:ubiquinone/menaquinone biosynthesis C-methylase UbiE